MRRTLTLLTLVALGLALVPFAAAQPAGRVVIAQAWIDDARPAQPRETPAYNVLLNLYDTLFRPWPRSSWLAESWR
jgi:hypothetical protein